MEIATTDRPHSGRISKLALFFFALLFVAELILFGIIHMDISRPKLSLPADFAQVFGITPHQAEISFGKPAAISKQEHEDGDYLVYDYASFRLEFAGADTPSCSVIQLKSDATPINFFGLKPGIASNAAESILSKEGFRRSVSSDKTTGLYWPPKDGSVYITLTYTADQRVADITVNKSK